MNIKRQKYALSEEESIRINILKFISIIFVVYIHSYATTSNFSDIKGPLGLSEWLLKYQFYISQIISRCGVPLFFLISAVLFFSIERKYINVVKSKFKTILIPYLFWNSFWIAIWAFLQQLTFTSVFFSGDSTNIMDCNFIEWLGLYGIGSRCPQDYPLWFMRDLFIIFLIFPLLKMFLNKVPKISLLIGVILTFLPDIHLTIALSWFIIGGFIVKNDLHMIIVDKIPFKLLIIVYLVSSLITLLFPNIIVRTLFMYIGIIFWIKFSKIIYNNKKLRNIVLHLSQWTFIIYVFHELTLSSIKKVFIRIFPISDISLCLQYTLTPLLVIGICILVGIITNKLFPRFYTLITGGRKAYKN